MLTLERIKVAMEVGEITKEIQERRLKWYVPVMRRDAHYTRRRAMAMNVRRKRKTGSPRRRWLDMYDRATWRRMPSYIDPHIKV